MPATSRYDNWRSLVNQTNKIFSNIYQNAAHSESWSSGSAATDVYGYGRAHLWHPCPKRHAPFTALRFLFLYSEHFLYIAKIMRINMCDGVETVYDLLFLPNNVATETFLHKSGAMRSWMFITGAAAWRWLGDYVILGKTFHNIRF
jgi:hypothetical protein